MNEWLAFAMVLYLVGFIAYIATRLVTVVLMAKVRSWHLDYGDMLLYATFWPLLVLWRLIIRWFD